MKLIRKGAEGDLFLTTWNDKEAILKSRKKKDYRNSSLDYRLRKQRTIRESQIMSEVKEFGIRTPLIHFVDIKNCDIIMQKIDGVLVGDLSKTKLVNSCKKIGKLVGIMHKNGIAHGDLTTSNFIESGNNIFIIDFGLANRTLKSDDHAVQDLQNGNIIQGLLVQHLSMKLMIQLETLQTRCLELQDFQTKCL